jgi:hypothetical protein
MHKWEIRIPQETSDMVAVFLSETVTQRLQDKRMDDSLSILHKTYRSERNNKGKTKILHSGLIDKGYINLKGYKTIIKGLRYKLSRKFLSWIDFHYLRKKDFHIDKV